MAKELPYFRFTVQDWQNGKISLENFEMQGLFINVCGYYWINDCNMTLATLKKKFSNATLLLQQLIELGILKHENRHDKIEIEFLNIQYDLLSETRKLRQSAGSKGGNAKAMLKQKGSYKDKDNNKDNNKDKFNAKAYMFSLGYDEKLISEWFEVRKLKKLKNTETALESFHKEVMQAKTNINDVLKTCVEKSWGGFKAGWIKPANEPKKEVSPILMK